MDVIFDIWHPDLTKKEIKFLSFLRKAEMKLEKKLCKLAAANDHNLTKDDDLVKQALNAIEAKPQFESQILDSLLEKLKQQSGQ